MNQTQSAAQIAHADGHSVEEVKKHVRQYLIIGAALIAGTILTVWASLINFGSKEINIVVALVIASAKGFLVVGFFMHLLSEKKMIYSVLATTVFFFAALLYLTLWSMAHGSIVQIR
ncbi:MAG TPA: cytochrome C oxidase subunit IV family protein [Verrucomicrobiae bacterium]|jgi:cytochrome c oxidase subunit 4|nr:cytochrome C oxidase subunit IV family protein [Verrucomicrobiae bacterium]